MSLISTGSISLDSTFKGHGQILLILRGLRISFSNVENLLELEDLTSRNQEFSQGTNRKQRGSQRILVVHISSREYWIIYREKSSLVVEWFGSSPTPFPPLPATSCLSFSVFLCVTCRASWWGGGGGGGGRPRGEIFKKKLGKIKN